MNRYATLARMMAVPARLQYRLMRDVMVGAGVLYCSLLLEVAAGFPLNIHYSFLSELGAKDQSTGPYARAMDLGSGVLLVLAAILGRPAIRIHRDVGGLLVSAAVFGVGTMSDAVFPMDCAPSLSQACRDAEANGQTGAALILHETTSTLAGVGSVAMGIFAVLVLRRLGWGGVPAKAIAVLAGGVAVTQAWLGIETGVEVLTGNDLHPPGILQRVSVLLVCLLMATLLPGLRQAFIK
ncbi:DUF998 domain-containing protein [Kribbella qitaiheensis]|uniref:DUF998 domain-containing protein n=1 Tax=Kribbella qitaiheensis TaxID=1544730 RepID=A0A7G6WZF3_9ACTN|nr:DUF998 domain-containing protein [Kribbella qitaiheensis]QNE19368.1 DUF998 domain-containing protein [Kribbella qitaiheensis]